MYENRVFNRILVLGPKREEVTGVWSKLHSEELHNLFSSHTVRLIKLRRWEKQIAHMREKRYVYNGLVGKPEGRISLAKPKSVHIRILSKQILKEQDRRVWNGFIRLRTGTSSGLL
jgi:hypothetical protein